MNTREKFTKEYREKQELAMRDRKIAYQTMFGQDTPGSKAVLADLKVFCRANRSTFDADPRVHALLEGRREVVLRIIDHLELTVEQLVAKYGGN